MSKESFSVIEKGAVTADVMNLVNSQSLKPLDAEDVFLFRMVACDNQVDRDFEYFTNEALEGLAKLYVGRSVICDHDWSAKSQTARIYDAYTETEGKVKRLILCAYLLCGEDNAGTIAAIEGGILREVSVGCAMGKSTCSICGAERPSCRHRGGEEYNGIRCSFALSDPRDAYEVSFVAVPAQPGAGVVKRWQSGKTPDAPAPQVPQLEELEQRALRVRLGLL